jgi:hypothetical protein
MRVAKFNIPVIVFPEFLKYTQPLGLKSSIISTQQDLHEIEIPFTKEQNSSIDELEQVVEVFLLASAIGIIALNILIEEISKSTEIKTSTKAKKETSTKSDVKDSFYFKDLLQQAKKAERQ